MYKVAILCGIVVWSRGKVACILKVPKLYPAKLQNVICVRYISSLVTVSVACI